MKNLLKSAIGHAPGTHKLGENDYLHFYYANNKGRGDSNCSIVRTTNPTRTGSEQTQIDAKCIANTRCSSWAGNVNFSLNVQSRLGL